MQKSLMQASVLLLMLSMGSCVEDVDSDRANGILSVSQNGLTIIDAYDLGSQNSINLSVAKGGLQDNGGTVTFQVDADVLDSLNNANGTTYEMLPENCYTLENATFTVPSGGDRYVPGGKLTYDPAKIHTLAGFENKKYALAFRVTTTGTPINSTRSTAIYVFNIKEAIIDLISTGGDVTVASDGKVEGEMPLKLKVGFENQWDLSLAFNYKGEDYVDSYNATNGTYLTLLAANNYTIANASISKGKKTGESKIVLDGATLTPGNYLLPIAISSLTGQGDAKIKYNVESVAEYLISKLGTKIDRSSWVITGTTEEETGESNGANGRFKHMIDGDKTTFWHSHWSQPQGEVSAPYGIKIDMGKVNAVSQIGLLPRQDALTTMNIEFYAGEDEHGTLIGKYYFDGSSKTEKIVPVKVADTRYIYLYIPTLGSGSKVGHMAEIYVYGTDK